MSGSSSTQATFMSMRESMIEAHREAVESRTHNTKKTYVSKQAEYRAWYDKVCANLSSKTRYIVYGEKMHLFLKQEVHFLPFLSIMNFPI